jgi:NAD(P)-dependent dehydrogenase (short-subunit alcohol dehydrogenase family)
MSAQSSPKGAAIVAGASQGIGREIAIQLANDGYAVAVNDISRQCDAVNGLVEELSKSGRSIAVLGDVSKEEDVQSMVAKAVQELGDLQVVSRPTYVTSWSQSRIV